MEKDFNKDLEFSLEIIANCLSAFFDEDDDNEEIIDSLDNGIMNYSFSALHYVVYSVKKQYKGIGQMSLQPDFAPNIDVDYSACHRIYIDVKCCNAKDVIVCFDNKQEVEEKLSVDDAIERILEYLKEYERENVK